MLSEKPWKSEATVRLLLSVFACIYGGSLLVSTMRFALAPGKLNGWVFGAVDALALAGLAVTLVQVARPLDYEHLRRRLITILVCFYVALFAGAWVHRWVGEPGRSVWQTVIAALSFQGAVVVLVTRFLREHEVNWRTAFGLRHYWPQAVVAGLLGTCLLLPVAVLLERGAIELVTRVHVAGPPEEQQVVQVLRVAVSWLDRTVLGVITIVLAPVAEELLFRGILYPWGKRIGFPRLSFWGTSMAFALMHMNLVTLLPLFLLAVVWTWLYERTDNLLAPIAAHSLFNALNFTLLYLPRPG